MKQISDKNAEGREFNDLKDSIPKDEAWDKFKNKLYVILFILLILFCIWLCSCSTNHETFFPEQGCFYFSELHAKQKDQFYIKKEGGIRYMTVAGKEYTFWTNDYGRLKEYRNQYPDAIFVTCFDNTKNISEHFRHSRPND